MNTSASLKIYLLVFFVFWHLIPALGDCHSVAARPLTDEAVAGFYKNGVFDPQQISEDELYESIKAAYDQETDGKTLDILADRLLKLKWWRLWEANFEMAAETVIVGDPLERYFRPSDNWQWTEIPPGPPLEGTAGQGEKEETAGLGEKGGRVHYSVPVDGLSRHGVSGTFPYILPVNGTLLQPVYFFENQMPDQIALQIETGYLLGQQQPTFIQARWTKSPENRLATENRPHNFWAGTFSPPFWEENGGGWYLLSVNLCDIGLCGRDRIIRGIEYIVTRGDAWFGQTTIRRPQVEIRGTKKYHLFSVDDELAFDIAVHNFSDSNNQYTLNLIVSDYNGEELVHSMYNLDIPGKSSKHETLLVNPGNKRYFVFEYTLSKGDTTLYHGYNAATVIKPNQTGRKDHTKFGMMYWDQPGQDMVELYEKLGVKLIIIFPEMDRLHLFDSQKFAVMPMIWALPEREPQEVEKIEQDIRPYLDSGQHIFSNFWETDLRVPAEMFAPNMRKFCQVIKYIEPAAFVGIGGMAWFNVAYINQLLQFSTDVIDPRSFFDFMTFMLYNTPSPPEFSGIEQETAAIASLLTTHGRPDTELWNVEWSYFEHLNLDGGHWLNRGVPRDLIAPYTIRHHLLGFASGIARMVPGTNIYVGRTPLAKNYGHSMSLGRSSVTRYDLSPLPLLPAYSVMTRMLEGKKYVTNIGQDPNIICQVYHASDESYTTLSSSKTVLVAWTLFGVENIVLPLFNDTKEGETKITLLNMVGDEIEQYTYNGALHLSISPEPTYILLNEEAAEILTKASRELVEESLLSPSPKIIEISPEKISTVKLTYRLFNPGWKALQGTLRLTQPNWLKVLRSDIQYPNIMRKLFATTIVGDSSSDKIWLGRNHRVEVIYEVLIPEEIARKTYYEQVEITKQPSFNITAVFESDGKILARAMTPVQVLPPLSVTLRPVLAVKDDRNSPRLIARMTNNSADTRQGTLRLKVPAKLRVEPGDVSFLIPSKQAQTYEFSLKGNMSFAEEYTLELVDTQLNRRTEQVSRQENEPAHLDHYLRNDSYLFSFGVGEGFVIEALVKDQQGYETRQSRGFAFHPAVKAKNPLLIDGQLNDWTEAVPLFVHPNERLSGLTFYAKDYGGEMQWSGLDDFSTAWQMMWDESFLYLAVKTFDEQFIPQHNLEDFWDGDTISFQIDPLPDLTDASIIPAQRDLREIHTFDVGLSKTGPRCRRKYPTYEKQAGAVEIVNVAITPVQDGVIYELAIPWDELAPLHPEIGGWMGFSLVFYEDDGAGRETRSNWFGGSGGNGLAREPRLMGDVHFVQ